MSDAARQHNVPKEVVDVMRYRLDNHGKRIAKLEEGIQELNLSVVIERQQVMATQINDLREDIDERLQRLTQIGVSLLLVLTAAILNWVFG